MKKLMFLLTVLMSVFVFASCSKDDDKDLMSDIEGTWVFTAEEGYESEDGYYYENNDPDEYWELTFYANGTGRELWSEIYGGEVDSEQEAFSWSISEGLLYIVYSGDDDADCYAIYELTDGKLVFGEAYGEEWYKDHFVRIR